MNSDLNTLPISTSLDASENKDLLVNEKQEVKEN